MTKSKPRRKKDPFHSFQLEFARLRLKIIRSKELDYTVKKALFLYISIKSSATSMQYPPSDFEDYEQVESRSAR